MSLYRSAPPRASEPWTSDADPGTASASRPRIRSASRARSRGSRFKSPPWCAQRVLDRVHVDGPAVGVLGPGGPAGHGPAVEGRGVVGRHRTVIVTAVVVDEPHPSDGELRVEELGEHLHHVTGDVTMNDHLPGVDP